MISSYLQEIQSTLKPINYFGYRSSFNADYFTFFNEWSKYFEKISISLFDQKELVGNDIVKDFFYKHFHIDLQNYKRTEENPSLTRRFLAFKLLYNQKYEAGTLKYIIEPDKLLYRLLGLFSKNDNSGKVKPTRDDIEYINDKFKESNKSFFKKYMPGKSFKVPSPTNDKQFYEMDEVEFNEILEKFNKYKLNL